MLIECFLFCDFELHCPPFQTYSFSSDYWCAYQEVKVTLGSSSVRSVALGEFKFSRSLSKLSECSALIFVWLFYTSKHSDLDFPCVFTVCQHIPSAGRVGTRPVRRENASPYFSLLIASNCVG